MFVIGRGLHEQIQIGNSITVRVLRIGDKHVTLGIDAPKAVPLSRDESNTFPSVEGVSAWGCDLSVLIVDDTPIHTWLVEKAFNAYGTHHTRVARTGKEALHLLGLGPEPPEQPLPCDLILMDLQLPDIPGLEVIRRIRSARSSHLIPIVVMSYQDADTEVTRCLEAGATAFVPKPETQEGFRQAIFRIADFWSHARRVPVSSHVAQESLVC